MKKVLILVLFFCSTALATETFYVKNASRNFDMKIEVAQCENHTCEGKVKFSLFKKNRRKSFQIIDLSKTYISLNENNNPEIAKIEDKKNGKWSSFYLEDFNFDGFEDLAIADGQNGGYRGISYKVYLYSYKKKQFVFNCSFTKLAQGPFIGIFGIDYGKKMLETFWKSGSSFYETQKYIVFKNCPKKVYELTEDGMLRNGKTYITTKKLVGGKWRTWNKIVKDKN